MTIGLFAPLPLAMMIPFMAGQSLMMGEAFGKGFQYGKRKISSMSNEEFNALTPGDLGKSITTDYNAVIPHLERAIQDSKEFQTLVISELIRIIPTIPGAILEGLSPTQTSTSANIFGVSGSATSPPITNVRTGASGTRQRYDALWYNADVQAAAQATDKAIGEWIEENIGTYEGHTENTYEKGLRLAKAAADKARQINANLTKGFQQPTGPVNIRAVTLPKTTTLSRIQQVRQASAQNKIRLQETVKNLAPLINNKKKEIQLAKNRLNSLMAQRLPSPGVKTRGARQALLNNRRKWGIAVQTLNAQLAYLVKKLQNAITLLRNT